MATNTKTVKRRSATNLWQNEKTGRWHWELLLQRKDGTTYRRAGSRKEKTQAAADRDQAKTEFTRFEGRAGSWTVKSWGEHVAETVWPEELAETTMNAYAYSLSNHVYTKLGAVRLDALTVPQLQQFATALASSAGRNVAGNALSALGSILTRAVEAGLIPTNPARNVKLRKVAVEEESKMILTEAQQRRLMDASKGTCMEWPILLGLKFGLRMGEALGLRWIDIDLEAGVLRVQQQAQYVIGKGVQITAPKSKKGYRSLPIPPGLVQSLSEAKKGANSLYVCTRNGKLIGAKKSSHYFKDVALAAGFDEESGIPTHHDCRSTFLTHLANNANGGQGVKPHVLMAIAGHSSLATTMRYYLRASDDDLRAAMQCVS
ncbi:MAG: site-specific integrase [Armatimonadetes bacterium]|nr:site-specific integrase [Armatimonadota bacterium]